MYGNQGVSTSSVMITVSSSSSLGVNVSITLPIDGYSEIERLTGIVPVYCVPLTGELRVGAFVVTSYVLKDVKLLLFSSVSMYVSEAIVAVNTYDHCSGNVISTRMLVPSPTSNDSHVHSI